MSFSSKVFKSGTDDKLLVKDPNESFRSRVINNNSNTTNNFTKLKDTVVTKSTKNAAESLLRGIELKDVLLQSERESALDKLSIGAKRDLLDSVKRLLPGEYSVLLDNAEDLIRGKKKIVKTASGNKYYGLEEIGFLKDLFNAKEQWDRYQSAKEREEGYSTDPSTESVIVSSMSSNYIKLGDSASVISLLDSLDETTREMVCKTILKTSVQYSQFLLTKYVVETLSSTYVNFEYPEILPEITGYYNKEKSGTFEQGKDNLIFILELLHSINKDFLMNPYSPTGYTLQLFSIASQDFKDLVFGYEEEQIAYSGVSLETKKLTTVLEVSDIYKVKDHAKDLMKQFPFLEIG